MPANRCPAHQRHPRPRVGRPRHPHQPGSRPPGGVVRRDRSGLRRDLVHRRPGPTGPRTGRAHRLPRHQPGRPPPQPDRLRDVAQEPQPGQQRRRPEQDRCGRQPQLRLPVGLPALLRSHRRQQRHPRLDRPGERPVPWHRPVLGGRDEERPLAVRLLPPDPPLHRPSFLRRQHPPSVGRRREPVDDGVEELHELALERQPRRRWRRLRRIHHRRRPNVAFRAPATR